jgi:enoyl-CoA hydratase/carnithine racemase
MVAVHVEDSVFAAHRVATDARGDGLPAQGVGLAADGGGVGVTSVSRTSSNATQPWLTGKSYFQETTTNLK